MSPSPLLTLLGRWWTQLKTRWIIRNQKGMYIIPCSCGKVYIGETGRSINICLEEHALDITRDRASKSALAEHSHNSSHHVCIENVKILTREEHYLKTWVKEAMEIDKWDNTLNRDDGLKLSGTWKPIINKIKRQLKEQWENIIHISIFILALLALIRIISEIWWDPLMIDTHGNSETLGS